jgi:hypothetical protein
MRRVFRYNTNLQVMRGLGSCRKGKEGIQVQSEGEERIQIQSAGKEIIQPRSYQKVRR